MSVKPSVTLLKSTISHLGGLEKYALRLLHAFEEKGCDVTLLTTGSVSSLETLCSCRIFTHTFSRSLSFQRVAEFDRFCKQSLIKHPSSVVFGLDRNREQTHIRAGNGVHAAYLERRRRNEGFFKGLSFEINPLHKLLLSIEKQSFENPELRILFTNSEMVKKEVLSHYNVNKAKVQVIHNGVEWKELQNSFDSCIEEKLAIADRLQLDPHKFHFLFIGHNFARKGLDLLLDALAILKRKDFHLSVIGTDKNIERYKKKVQAIGLSNSVTFWGQRKDVVSFYQLTDCLVIPSLYDPFANVTVEALAMGLFVVSSKHNGASEVLTPYSGSVIEDLFSIESFADSLTKAMQRPKSVASSVPIRESVKMLDFSHQLQLMVEKTLLTI